MVQQQLFAVELSEAAGLSVEVEVGLVLPTSRSFGGTAGAVVVVVSVGVTGFFDGDGISVRWTTFVVVFPTVVFPIVGIVVGENSDSSGLSSSGIMTVVFGCFVL